MTQGPVTPVAAGAVTPRPVLPGHLLPGVERAWAAGVHLLALASPLGLPALGPLAVYLACRNRSAFVRQHAAAALNLQLVLLAVLLATVPIAIVLALVAGPALALLYALTIGYPAAAVFVLLVSAVWAVLLASVLVLLAVAVVVLHVVAAVAAHRGQVHRYPVTPTLVV